MTTTVTRRRDIDPDRYDFATGTYRQTDLPTAAAPCPPDGCDYREVTPHGLRSAAFVECARCGHTGWLIVT